MPPRKTIVTDPNGVICRLRYVEIKRQLDGESLRVRLREDRREYLRQSWTGSWNPKRSEPRPESEIEEQLGPDEPYVDLTEGWQDYKLEFLAGLKSLTASERIRWQQCIRGLAADGLVELAGERSCRIRLTEEGRQRVEATLEADQ